MDSLEEGELDLSPAPSQSELDMLATDWTKKVSWKSKKEKEEKVGKKKKKKMKRRM